MGWGVEAAAEARSRGSRREVEVTLRVREEVERAGGARAAARWTAWSGVTGRMSRNLCLRGVDREIGVVLPDEAKMTLNKKNGLGMTT